MPSPFAQLQHIVVVMLENRSFDNMLGFLHADQGNVPPLNLPAQTPPTFDGLQPAGVSDAFWNPSNEEYFDGADPVKVFATSGTTGSSPLTVPDPDPSEAFEDITFQLFGKDAPSPDVIPGMRGFLVDYQKAKGSTVAGALHIMESYSPRQVPVLSQLAKNFAVCDRWFASVPAQTWPNRGFWHTGTARGQVSNSGPWVYNTETIFEVLQKAGHTWGIYNDTLLPSLSKLMYPRLGLFPTHFHGFGQFQTDARHGTLPSYSCVEPSFTIEPNDQHPPHNVADGERFLADVWKAVSTGAHWQQTLLIITYDEHGGCYDHVPPPWGAASPDAESDGIAGAPFNRFGVRVPAVVISPFIEPGTVFRSPTSVPFDHTSVLATLRDWLGIPSSAMLPSLRIAAAPTLEFLLTRTEARATLPAIAAPPQLRSLVAAPAPVLPLNDLQFSMIVSVERIRQQRELSAAEIEDLRTNVPTTAHMVQFFKDRGLTGRA